MSYDISLKNNYVSDVLSGASQFEISDSIVELTIQLLISLDGACFYESKTDTMWPVQAMVLNLPLSVRQAAENLILMGLYAGKSKPKWDSVFPQIVSDFPLHFTFYVASNVVKVSVKLKLCVMDLIASAPILNIKQFNGIFGCMKCLHPGSTIKTSKGGYVRYYDLSLHPLRTHETHQKHAFLAHNTGEHIFGVK